MAIRYAVANGNWSSVATWDGGATLPTHGDMVYANGKTVVIDQNIDIGNEVTATAGAFIVGQLYVITSVGTTNFTLIGAASNAVGVAFIATGVGAGTGQAQTRSGIINSVLAAPSILTNGGFTLNANYDLRMSIIGGGTAALLTVGSNASTTITGDVGFNRASGTALSLTSPGTIIINGSIRGPSAGAGTSVLISSSGVIFTLNGNIIGATSSSSKCINASIAGSVVNVNGDIGPSSASSAYGIYTTVTNTTVNMNGNVTGGSSSNSEAIIFLSTGGTLNMIGNTTGLTSSGIGITSGTLNFTGTSTGGPTSSGFGISIAGGTSILNGTFLSGTSGGSVYIAGSIGNTYVTINGDLTPNVANVPIVTQVAANLIVNGNLLSGPAVCISTSSGQNSVTINGNVTGGTGTNNYGIDYPVGNSTLTVNGSVTGGTGANAVGVNGATSTIANTIIVTGDVTASSSANGIRSTSSSSSIDVSIGGNLVDDANGVKAVMAAKWYWATTPTNKTYTVSVNKVTPYTLYSNDVWAAEYPIEADVRENVLFGAGDIYTGTLAVPNPATVALGVPTDNTTGTATSDPSAIAGAVRTELTTELGRIDAAVSTRLASADYNAPIAAATIATAVRSELTTELARIDIPVSDATTDISGIPGDVRTELAVELARIDAAISSRLATAGYTTPETKEAIAVAVEAALLNEGDGQQLIDAILQVINSNLDLPALELTAIANAVRTELAVELARIDIPVSDATTDISGIPLAVRNELATELARIDIPVSDATTDISGIPTAVRGELAVELARIDANVSTAGDPVTIAGAVRTELTTELARIDIPVSDATTDISGIPTAVRNELAVELERVANCSTVDTTGAQLAALL